MRWATLFLVVMLAGCGSLPNLPWSQAQRLPVRRGNPDASGNLAALSCTDVASHCAIASFKGFPEFADYEVMPIDSVEYCEASYQDANLSTPDGTVNIASGGASAYTYQYPTTLFGASKYPNFRSDLLCADIGFGSDVKFPNLGPRSYIWHGDSINVQPEDRNVTARYKGWTAVFNEVIEAPGSIQIAAAHFIGPGRREVWLSQVTQRCTNHLTILARRAIPAP
jgi:hypothetical protein